MAGTIAGGRKAAAKNLANDPDFYKRIGKIGGARSTTGGFAADRQLAREAGRKGGRISRRGKSRVTDEAVDKPVENFVPQNVAA